MMTKPGRIPCCIPFCTRTGSEEKYGKGAEIICGIHWRMASKRTKARYRKVCRLGRRFAAMGRDTSRLHRMAMAIWEQCKQEIMP